MTAPPRPDLQALAVFTDGVVPYIEWLEQQLEQCQKAYKTTHRTLEKTTKRMYNIEQQLEVEL